MTIAPRKQAATRVPRIRRNTGNNVFNEALGRMIQMYEEGYRVVVSHSGGKDSAVILEVTIEAARATGNLPVDVVHREEEIMYPGTYEYLDQMAQRPEINFKNLVAHQPSINVCNRAVPYWWVMDPLVPSSKWVRQPDRWCEEHDSYRIGSMIHPGRYPLEGRKSIVTVTGLRVQESKSRLYGLMSSRGFLTKPDKKTGVRLCRPIYDWTDADVWLAMKEYHWRYNTAYDVMYRLGLPRQRQRVAPPTMSNMAVLALALVAPAWPKWIDAVCERLPGVRTAIQFGRRSVEPWRWGSETWRDTFYRECITEAPGWIAERSQKTVDKLLEKHRRHATGDLPMINHCQPCGPAGSWRQLARAMYSGDPFSFRCDLPEVPPSYFRPGAPGWDGERPTW